MPNPIRLKLTTLLVAAASAALAQTPRISFSNIARDPAMNLSGFKRARSAGYAQLMEAYRRSQTAPMSMGQVFAQTPHATGGFSGVALIDFDRDGDTDIYVTNGPGAANGLFRNLLKETGKLGFQDVSAVSGADATDQDSNGVCFGDVDNDGDEDLYVLGRESANRLYENLGGRFREVKGHGAEGGSLSHVSCSMGDIDGDGLLDIAVSNVFKFENGLALVAVPYEKNQHNQLFRNSGRLTFTDVSESSGILEMALGGTTDSRPPTISWAVAMVDIDRDGDIDIVFADDQAAMPTAAAGGFDRGYVQIFLNDGRGRFRNAPVRLNGYSSGDWMSLGFGDFDCNGTLDLFGSNLGDYMFAALGMPSRPGAEASRWLLGHGNGAFWDPPASSATAFGWGSAVADLDNDGDHDVLYHGALNVNAVITQDNPGVVLENQACRAQFIENLKAFRGDYTMRGTQGVAAGDLDRDGYIDVVTASSHNIPAAMPFFLSPAKHGSALDATSRFYLPMIPDPITGMFRWGGLETLPGDLTVEINNGEGRAAATFAAAGGVGVAPGARNNRSGIGAIVTFTPLGGRTVSLPVVGGSSFMSQHALEAHFGMDNAPTGTVEIQWPGGVHNRLYRVRAGERLVLPEIPCSIDSLESIGGYDGCVRRALESYVKAGVVSGDHALRLQASALDAYYDRRQ
jgi:hypothetical protein